MSLPPSEAGICNAALGHVEHTYRIDSLNDGSPEAESCRTHFDKVRRQILRDITYSFATEFLRLSSTKDDVTTPESLPYVYQMEPGVLKVLSIEDVERQIWRMAGKTNRLHTIYEPPIIVQAVIDIEEIARFEPDAVSDFELLLAVHLAPRWSKSQNRAKILWDRYTERVKMAAGNEGSEGGDALQDRAAEIDWRDHFTPGYYGPYGSFGPWY